MKSHRWDMCGVPKKSTTAQLRAEAAVLLGAITTPKKARAARRNGRLGGRPRKDQ